MLGGLAVVQTELTNDEYDEMVARRLTHPAPPARLGIVNVTEWLDFLADVREW